MTNQKARSTSSQVKRWATVVSSLSQSLPTLEEKEAVLRSLDEVLVFFGELRSKLQAIPTVEKTQKIQEKVESLALIFGEVERFGKLGRSGKARGARARQPGRTEISGDNAQGLMSLSSVLEKLRGADTNERQKILSGYSSQLLHRIAAELSLSPARRIPKDTLVHQISMRIANYQGYELLRGNGSTS